MGRKSGIIRKSATGSSFGEIQANDIIGLTAFFDVAEARKAGGPPGGLIKGARVSFEIDGRGRAVNIRKGISSDITGRKKKFQSVPG